MCGIFAYLNYHVSRERRYILQVLFNGLRRLEYRRYDSAGISMNSSAAPDRSPSDPPLLVFRQEGNIESLVKSVYKACSFTAFRRSPTADPCSSITNGGSVVQDHFSNHHQPPLNATNAFRFMSKEQRGLPPTMGTHLGSNPIRSIFYYSDRFQALSPEFREFNSYSNYHPDQSPPLAKGFSGDLGFRLKRLILWVINV